MMTRRHHPLTRLGLAATALALLTASATVSATAAHAAGTLEYRLDGGTWSATAPALFPSTWSPVPGASTSATLDIRSARAERTIVAVYVGSVSSSSTDVLQAMTFTGDAGSMKLSDLVGAGAACTLVTDQVVLKQGESLSVPVSLSLDANLAAGQSASLGFDLLIAASDTGPRTLSNGCPIDPAIVRAFPAPTPEPAPNPDDDPEKLPTSGAQGGIAAWLAGGAALLLGGGGALIALSRRGRRREQRADAAHTTEP